MIDLGFRPGSWGEDDVRRRCAEQCISGRRGHDLVGSYYMKRFPMAPISDGVGLRIWISLIEEYVVENIPGYPPPPRCQG